MFLPMSAGHVCNFIRLLFVCQELLEVKYASLAVIFKNRHLSQPRRATTSSMSES